jgi:hypothetical protein
LPGVVMHSTTVTHHAIGQALREVRTEFQCIKELASELSLFKAEPSSAGALPSRWAGG